MPGNDPKIPGATSTRRVLIVLWIPSADREGKSLPDQDEWKKRALEFFGAGFGGATAMPRAEGIWRDDGNAGKLIWEYPILIHCYVTEEQLEDKKVLARLGAFCRKMGKETRQGEIALLVDGVFYSFTDLS